MSKAKSYTKTITTRQLRSNIRALRENDCTVVEEVHAVTVRDQDNKCVLRANRLKEPPHPDSDKWFTVFVESSIIEWEWNDKALAGAVAL